MFKSVVRAAPRYALQSRSLATNSSGRRLLSTAPPSQKSRSWKSSALRWSLALGGVYYYNTSNVFAEEPEAAISHLDDSIRQIKESKLNTIDAIVEEKRQRESQQAEKDTKRTRSAKAALEGEGQADGVEGEENLGGLEEEADQQGAFNPETGEINWDCPCLGGMAHGPCGEQFKAAFSCFVYSTEEPKGMECIEKFQGMQDCFRQHPEMYGSELEDDEDDVEGELLAREAASPSSDSDASPHASQPVTPTTIDQKTTTDGKSREQPQTSTPGEKKD